MTPPPPVAAEDRRQRRCALRCLPGYLDARRSSPPTSWPTSCTSRASPPPRRWTTPSASPVGCRPPPPARARPAPRHPPAGLDRPPARPDDPDRLRHLRPRPRRTWLPVQPQTPAPGPDPQRPVHRSRLRPARCPLRPGPHHRLAARWPNLRVRSGAAGIASAYQVRQRPALSPATSTIASRSASNTKSRRTSALPGTRRRSSLRL